MTLGKMQTITSTELKVWLIKLKGLKMTLEKQNKWLLRALLTVAALCMIGLFIVIRTYEKQADLGKIVLETGVCVEYPLGYQCATPDNFVFIEK